MANITPEAFSLKKFKSKLTFSSHEAPSSVRNPFFAPATSNLLAGNVARLRVKERKERAHKEGLNLKREKRCNW